MCQYLEDIIQVCFHYRSIVARLSQYYRSSHKFWSEFTLLWRPKPCFQTLCYAMPMPMLCKSFRTNSDAYRHCFSGNTLAYKPPAQNSVIILGGGRAAVPQRQHHSLWKEVHTNSGAYLHCFSGHSLAYKPYAMPMPMLCESSDGQAHIEK